MNWKELPTGAASRWADGRTMTKNIVGLAIFGAGIALLILGFNESQSFSSDVSRFFTGNPTDRSVWFLVGGGIAIVVGLFVAIRGWGRE